MSRAAGLLLALWLAGCHAPAPPPPPPSDPLPTPPLWIVRAPQGDPLAGDPLAGDPPIKLLGRLPAAALDVAERRFGPPVAAGALRGWWLRPVGWMASDSWLCLSVSGGLYAIDGSPRLTPQPDLQRLARVGRDWRARLMAEAAQGEGSAGER